VIASLHGADEVIEGSNVADREVKPLVIQHTSQTRSCSGCQVVIDDDVAVGASEQCLHEVTPDETGSSGYEHPRSRHVDFMRQDGKLLVGK
jgi:hypothetical protein